MSRYVFAGASALALLSLSAGGHVLGQTTSPPSGTPTAAAGAIRQSADTVSEVVVTASRVDLLGAAQTASQGSVTQEEL